MPSARRWRPSRSTAGWPKRRARTQPWRASWACPRTGPGRWWTPRSGGFPDRLLQLFLVHSGSPGDVEVAGHRGELALRELGEILAVVAGLLGGLRGRLGAGSALRGAAVAAGVLDA